MPPRSKKQRGLFDQLLDDLREISDPPEPAKTEALGQLADLAATRKTLG